MLGLLSKKGLTMSTKLSNLYKQLDDWYARPKDLSTLAVGVLGVIGILMIGVVVAVVFCFIG
jgi:hypothetical protein